MPSPIFVMPRDPANWGGAAALWVTVAGWAGATRRRGDTPIILTPSGALTEAECLQATALAPAPPRSSASRIPAPIRQALRDGQRPPPPPPPPPPPAPPRPPLGGPRPAARLARRPPPPPPAPAAPPRPRPPGRPPRGPPAPAPRAAPPPPSPGPPPPPPAAPRPAPPPPPLAARSRRAPPRPVRPRRPRPPPPRAPPRAPARRRGRPGGGGRRLGGLRAGLGARPRLFPGGDRRGGPALPGGGCASAPPPAIGHHSISKWARQCSRAAAPSRARSSASPANLATAAANAASSPTGTIRPVRSCSTISSIEPIGVAIAGRPQKPASISVAGMLSPPLLGSSTTSAAA